MSGVHDRYILVWREPPRVQVELARYPSVPLLGEIRTTGSLLYLLVLACRRAQSPPRSAYPKLSCRRGEIPRLWTLAALPAEHLARLRRIEVPSIPPAGRAMFANLLRVLSAAFFIYPHQLSRA